MVSRRARSKASSDEGAGAAWARRKLATMLRQLREQADLTQEDAAAHIERHVTTIHKIENGLAGVRLRPVGDIQRLGELYGAPQGDIEMMKKLVETTRVKGPYISDLEGLDTSREFNLYLQLERDANGIASFDNVLIPGQLQTEAYASAINSLPGVDGRPRSHEEIDKRVALRLERQTALTRTKAPLQLDAILMENVLRLPFKKTVMAEQLRHMVEMSRLPHVSIRLIPASAGLHLGFVTNQFIILIFSDNQPPFVYCDTYLGGTYLKESKEIKGYEEAFKEISSHALNRDESRAFIERVAKEWAENA